MHKYTSHVQTKVTPQSEQARPDQVQNSAGGFAFALDDWGQLDRFLILGSEGGTYYASERKLTKENAAVVQRLLKVDGIRLVDRAVEISEAGRAPKNDPALLVIAMAAKLGDPETRKHALLVMPRVARIGTHLFHWADFVDGLGGWGRGTRRAVARWYTDRPLKDTAYQVAKYQSRDGWSHRDLMRLSHVKTADPGLNTLIQWAGARYKDHDTALPLTAYPELDVLKGFEAAKDAKAHPGAVAAIVTQHRLPRECVPSEALNSPEVWKALLPNLGAEALIRNLAKLTAVGLLNPLSETEAFVVGRLGDAAWLQKSRLHPVKVLTAMRTYAQGHGEKGSLRWTPNQNVVAALDAAFYHTFQNVTPAQKRFVLALDVSGSMSSGTIAGAPGVTPRVGVAAMSLITAATEPRTVTIAFSSGTGRAGMNPFNYKAPNPVTEVAIRPGMRLDDVVRRTEELAVGMGGTDCALPMLWAMDRGIEADAFVVYTDNETWAGAIHPFQALKKYRAKTGIDAKLVVVGMTATRFTIADPTDKGMLDVVGFDAAAPDLISSFVRGDF